MNASLNSGYIVKDEASFDIRYRCLVCLHLLRDPVQLDCGHRICQICISVENNFVRCVECQEKTIFSHVKLDKGCHKDMQTLKVSCIFCEWVGQLKLYQDHFEKSHQQYTCSYCGEIFDSQPVIEQHKEKLCTKKILNCILQRYGCKEQIRRGDLQRHYLSEEHQRALILGLNQLCSQFIEQNQTSNRNFDTNMEIETADLPTKTTTTSSTTITTPKYVDELEHFNEMIDILSRSIHTLNDDLIRLSSESLEQSQSVEMTDKIVPMIKMSVEESNSILDAMATNLTILKQELCSLKENYDDLQVTSYDGTLIWRISQFQEKMTDAESERQVSVYSPPFFSSPTGYKMRARLYLYGDGNARRTHMSLFFVLMRGPHDSILKFPFSYKVTFCLFDLTVQQRHIIDSFRPDIKSNSFQRPRSEMNIASGIPKFVPLSILEKPDNPYIREDTIFIKVMVDFENMSKTILPYVFNLNPGLPMHAQQWMIREEIKRRAQQSSLASQGNLTTKDSKNN